MGVGKAGYEATTAFLVPLAQPASENKLDVTLYLPLTHTHRSVAEWFDEHGVLQLDKFFTEVKNIHSDLTKTKKDN